jgi:hypothetical protein
MVVQYIAACIELRTATQSRVVINKMPTRGVLTVNLLRVVVVQ